jgi:ABC-type Na+ transport system ATPase subunit NatA
VLDKNGSTVGHPNQTDPSTIGGAPMIEARLAVKQFGEGAERFRALDEVSVASGCGKTTLLRLFAGFEHPDSGDILLEGAPIAHLPPFQRPVNTVFQNYALFPHMSVAGNVAFGLEMQGRPRAEIASRVDEMLRLVRMDSMRSRKITRARAFAPCSAARRTAFRPGSEAAPRNADRTEAPAA